MEETCGLSIAGGGSCPNKLGTLQAPGSNGEMRRVCKNHGKLFGWPARAPTRWKQEGWDDFNEAQKINYWVELQNRQGLPRQKETPGTTGLPAGAQTGPPTGAQRGRTVQQRPQQPPLPADGSQQRVDEQRQENQSELRGCDKCAVAQEEVRLLKEQALEEGVRREELLREHGEVQEQLATAQKQLATVHILTHVHWSTHMHLHMHMHM